MVEHLEPFLAHLQHLDREPATIKYYRSNLLFFFRWFTETSGQPGTVTNVTPLDIRQYREHLKDRYKPRTVNKKLDYVCGFFQWCKETGLISANPTEAIKRVKIAPQGPQWLNKGQIYKILRTALQIVQLAQARGHKSEILIAQRIQTTISLMLHTGIRVSELCALRCEDVRLGQRLGVLIVRYGKGNKYREVPLNNDARKAVRAWLDVRPEGTYLFGAPDGHKISRQHIHKQLGHVGKLAGVKLSPHLLRHTFGKSLIDAGVSLDQVAMLMGHSSVSTTTIYTVPNLNDLTQAVDKIAWSD